MKKKKERKGRVERVIEKIERIEKREIVPEEHFTLQDAAQAVVGSVVALLAQFNFVDPVNFSRTLPMFNIVLVFFATWITGILVLVATGYRKRRLKLVLGFMPLRLVYLYVISYVMTTISLMIVGAIIPGRTSLEEALKVSIFINYGALLGAIAGDLVRD